MGLMSTVLLPISIIIGLTNNIRGYSTGNIPSAYCNSMVPNHSGTPQSGTAPFEFDVSVTEYSADDIITVTLQQTGSDTFKGFFVQARTVSDDTIVGTFTPGSNQQTRCSGEAIAHSNDNDRTSVTLTWTAPSSAVGNIIFRATVVEAYATYWTEIDSDVVSDPEDDSTVATPPDDDRFNIDLDSCGQTKGCFRKPCGCSAGNCDVAVAWKPKEDGNDYIQFQMIARNEWVALGFSDDSRMGDDYVVMCIKDGDTAVVKSAYNDGYDHGEFDDADYGISNAETYYEDGVVKCKFRRQIDSSTVNGSESSNFFDISNKYTLFLGTGPSSGGSALKHDDTPYISDNKIRVTTSTEDLCAETINNSMYKAHGILMITAWLLLISFSMLFARFYKESLPEKKICGVMVWFAVHRVINIIALICFVVPAFIIIFAKVGKYTEIGDSDADYLKAHAPLGIIVTSLCCINPLITLLRPNPDHRRRQLWNLFHWCIGYSACLLSFVVILIGFDMPKATAFIKDAKRDWTKWLSVVLMCWSVIIWFVLEVLRCRRKKKFKTDAVDKQGNKNAVGIQMDESTPGNQNSTHKISNAVDKQGNNNAVGIQMDESTPGNQNSTHKISNNMKVNNIILVVYFTGATAMFLAILIGIASAKTD